MDDIAEFTRLANQLKDVRRAGWVRCSVPDAESVADHAWGVCLLAVLLTPAELDRHRVLALAVVHDLAETITGDITPHDDVLPADKRAREQLAMDQLTVMAGGQELTTLWREYADGATAESRFVHELDALEMAGQAIAYELGGRLSGQEAERFIASASRKIHSRAIRAELERLISSRPTPDAGR